MKPLYSLFAVLLCVCLLGGCATQYATLPESCVVGDMSLQPDWWTKSAAQPKSAHVDVNGGERRIAVTMVKPTSDQVKAGVPSDAVGLCAPLKTLRGGESLVAVTEIEGAWTKSTACRYDSGDPYSYRYYGSPPYVLATIKPKITPVGATSGTCTTSAAESSVPPGGGDLAPSTAPPPVDVPAGMPIPTSWRPIASEGSMFVVEPDDYKSIVVRYGAPEGSAWVVKATASKVVNCTTKDFGKDPAPGLLKGCEVDVNQK